MAGDFEPASPTQIGRERRRVDPVTSERAATGSESAARDARDDASGFQTPNRRPLSPSIQLVEKQIQGKEIRARGSYCQRMTAPFNRISNRTKS